MAKGIWYIENGSWKFPKKKFEDLFVQKSCERDF